MQVKHWTETTSKKLPNTTVMMQMWRDDSLAFCISSQYRYLLAVRKLERVYNLLDST